MPAIAAELFRTAWAAVTAAPGAETPGSDGQTCAAVKRPQVWLAAVAATVAAGHYHPTKVRTVRIPKPGRPGQFRELGILTVRDRVVSAAARLVLEPRLEPTFHARSYAYRPGRSVVRALRAVLRHLDAPHHAGPAPLGWPLDVATCFDTIYHPPLLAALKPHAPALWFDAVSRLLTAHARSRHTGLVQGSPLSPLLCNLALHPLDQTLDRVGPTAVAFRYADDLLLVARNPAAARAARQTADRCLAPLRQRLHPGGTARPFTDGIPWLGLEIYRRPTGRHGLRVPAAVIGRLADGLARPDRAATPAVARLTALNHRLQGLRAAYQIADNAPQLFARLDRAADAALAAGPPAGLTRRSGKSPAWRAGAVQLIRLSQTVPGGD